MRSKSTSPPEMRKPRFSPAGLQQVPAGHTGLWDDLIPGGEGLRLPLGQQLNEVAGQGLHDP